jgi:hypothetical protein
MYQYLDTLTQRIGHDILEGMFGAGVIEVLLLVGVVLVLAVMVAWATARGPLRRGTVERFSRRQRLELTDGNAPHVVVALLVTHRWRRAGLVVGLGVGLLWSMRNGALTLHLIAGLLGWFVGAVVAEWRIGRLTPAGNRRIAGLAPRGISRYLTAEVRAIIALVGAGLVVLLVVSAVRGGVRGEWWAWLGYVLALGSGLGLTARAVVARPSGFVDGGVRAADDALRCHGLTVLAGSAVAAAYPALVGLALLAVYPAGRHPTTDPPWALAVVVVCLLTGYLVAVWSPSTRAAREPGSAEVSSPRPAAGRSSSVSAGGPESGSSC